MEGRGAASRCYLESMRWASYRRKMVKEVVRQRKETRITNPPFIWKGPFRDNYRDWATTFVHPRAWAS